MSITVDVSDELIAELGREKIEQELADAVKLLAMQQRRAKGERLFTEEELKELLYDLDEIDLTNDPAYQQAREKAWVTYTQIHNLTPDGQRKY